MNPPDLVQSAPCPDRQPHRTLATSGAVDVALHEHPSGGPVRLRRNGRTHRAVGLYFSVKSGWHLPFESKLELHDLWRAEIASEILRSDVQPFTLKFVLDGQLRRYT